jgi:arylformamidase
MPSRFVDLSHTIEDGLVTYPGLPAPSIGDHLSRDASRERYAPGYEFQIGAIEMVSNTGTYLDTPFHRFADGHDLSGIALEAVAALPIVVVEDGDALPDGDVAGAAVLVRTGWDRHFGTEAYGAPEHPSVGPELLAALVEARPALVGIDSVNVDATVDGERPVHTALLGAGIYVLEHLTGLDQLGDGAGWELFAVPVKVKGMGTFPVRAFAMRR